VTPWEEESFQSDTYIEALLAEHGRALFTPSVPATRLPAEGAPEGATPAAWQDAWGDEPGLFLDPVRDQARAPKFDPGRSPQLNPGRPLPVDPGRSPQLNPGRPLPVDPELDPELAAVATLLAGKLVRFHPSFRFEEALAARLRHAADGGVRLTAGGSIVPFPGEAGLAAAPTGRGPLGLDAPALDLGHAVEQLPRPVVVGGAIASGLAGAALVAWLRIRRPV